MTSFCRLSWNEVKILGCFSVLYTIIITYHLHRNLVFTGLGDITQTMKSKLYVSNIVSEPSENNDVDESCDQIVKEVADNKDPVDLWMKRKLIIAGTVASGLQQGSKENQDGGRRISGKKDVGVPGYFGTPVSTARGNLSTENQARYDKGWAENGFNQYVSDMIPVDRELPDLRHPECKQTFYGWYLSKMSVIISFHNEAWSTLLRTIHSVLKTTPPHLLLEIILVDDYSSAEHLQAPLDEYIQKLPKVRIVHLVKREGLIRARLTGVSVSKASVIVFLDSHCECIQGWAEPLLTTLKETPLSVVLPQIPTIDRDTFEFQHDEETEVQDKGVFQWDLTYRSVPLSYEERRERSSMKEPVRSATIPGSLFAINKDFFRKIGSFDPQLEIMGAEHMELSFKAHMCGGSVQIVPCSIVGHVVKKTSPETSSDPDMRRRNAQRVAEVWMDHYKTLFYDNSGVKIQDMGNIEPRLALRQRIKCQNFDWYLQNLYPNAFLPVNAQHKGTIRSVAFDGYCVDSVEKNGFDLPIRLKKCRDAGMTQSWYLTQIGELRSSYNCLDVGIDLTYQSVRMGKCHGDQGNQFWRYTVDQELKQPGTKSCLTGDASSERIYSDFCKKTQQQKWIWKPFNS